MVRGLPQIDHIDQVCDSCLAEKQRRLAFPTEAKYRAAHKLELVHGDLCGTAHAEAETGRKLGTLHTDRGGEFTVRNFIEHCMQEDIQRHLSTPYTLQQNLVVERCNQTVIGMARSLMKAMSIPVNFFRTFGCIAHVKANGKHLTKLEDQSTPMVFIGYEAGTKAWRFYNPVMWRVHVSCDAVLEESHPWD
ncbi:hypothetical protein U9M48_004610 [Paspalum notatum var. saurae]|uniref:Integrase catalytic domain-containing protein n=1 Tax=Paspalum notatum var. saurae TaxID=547442 RepID=A0AAQ3PNB8_PASNO